MLLAPRPLFSNFDGVMATDLALQDKRQADGAPFHYIVTLFTLLFLRQGTGYFIPHGIACLCRSLIADVLGSEEKTVGPSPGWHYIL